MLNRKDDQQAFQQPNQQQHYVPISVVPRGNSGADVLIGTTAGRSESPIQRREQSSSPVPIPVQQQQEQQQTSTTLRGEGTLERRIHHRNQLLRQQQPPQQQNQQPASAVRQAAASFIASKIPSAAQKEQQPGKIITNANQKQPVSKQQQNDEPLQQQQQQQMPTVTVNATASKVSPPVVEQQQQQQKQQQREVSPPKSTQQEQKQTGEPQRAKISEEKQTQRPSSKTEEPKEVSGSTKENEPVVVVDRLDWFYEVDPPASILEEHEYEQTANGSCSAKRRRVRFNRGPISVFNTFAAYDYDRRNEDVDPIAASAEYELEKLVDRMEVNTVELVKGPEGLGLSIISMGVGANCGVEKVGIFVKKITEGGAADIDGRIRAFDFIIEVDGTSLVGVTQGYAGDVLRATGDRVTLKVGREQNPETSEVVRLIKKSLEKEEKQAQARRELEAEEKRLQDLQNRIRKSREDEERLDEEMRKLSSPCASTRKFMKKDSSESPPKGGTASSTTGSSNGTSQAVSATATAPSSTGDKSQSSQKNSSSNDKQDQQEPIDQSKNKRISSSNSADSIVSDVGSLSDLDDVLEEKSSKADRHYASKSSSAPSSRNKVNEDADEYERMYTKYKEVQYKNAMAEAELAKLKAKIILLENAECQRAHYEQKCDEMASRLRESERALSQAHTDLQSLQTRLEQSQQSARQYDIVEAECRQLERKCRKQKQIIKQLQSREGELITTNDTLLTELDQRERSYKRTIAALNGQLNALESSLGEVQQMAVLSGSRKNLAESNSSNAVSSVTPTRRRRSSEKSMPDRDSQPSALSGISDADVDDDDVDDLSLSDSESEMGNTRSPSAASKGKNGSKQQNNSTTTTTLFIGDT